MSLRTMDGSIRIRRRQTDHGDWLPTAVSIDGTPVPIGEALELLTKSDVVTASTTTHPDGSREVEYAYGVRA